jgi:serine/threonine protein kinase
MQSQFDGFFFTLASAEYFEDFRNYKPTDELVQVAKTHLPSTRQLKHDGIWVYCEPTEYSLPNQGWKIHISGTILTAVETLEKLVPAFVEEGVGFKFAADLMVTELINHKNWSRGSSGKFITVYPRDEEHFRKVIETAYVATRGLKGPYVLSDKRYKDSKVVFYRYGAFRKFRIMNVYGEKIPAIASPDGKLIPDERRPFFRLPAWVRPPFQEETAIGNTSGGGGQAMLLHDRYAIKKAIKFSNAGGIYKATDTRTGKIVIIREARPHISVSKSGRDAFYLLEKEARLLKKLEHTGYVPQFIDLFDEWEHKFLVEEFLEGTSLFHYTLENVIDYTYLEQIDATAFSRAIVELIEKLANALQVIHDAGIILRDFTNNNAIVSPDGQIKFIDFELAFDVAEDVAVYGGTPGFASPQQVMNQRPTFADDYYALGALIFDALLLNVQYVTLNPKGVNRMLDELVRGMKLPRVVKDIIAGLMDEDVERRWTPQQALQALKRGESCAERTCVEENCGDIKAEIEATVEGVTSYILKNADFERDDRLWPSNPRVFYTNPLGLLYGATGTAYYLLRALKYVPEDIIEWINKRLDGNNCPPGLYNGLGGISWFMLDVGMEDKAAELLRGAYKPEHIFELPDIMCGAAGWGFSNLYFWTKTGEREFLERALEVGHYLLKTAKLDFSGYYWENNKEVYYGFGHGASGIATFLLYLYLAEGSSCFLETARRGLDFDLNKGVLINDRLVWVRSQSETGGPKYPHWRFGTAGVGAALIRFYAATGEQRYKDLAETCARSCTSKYSNKIWQTYGLAGHGELLLDMYQFLGDEKYLDQAYELTKGILLYRIDKTDGVAFPGLELLRISCDYGTGMAGTGIYLHRLLDPHLPRVFMIDHLLPERTREIKNAEFQLETCIS